MLHGEIMLRSVLLGVLGIMPWIARTRKQMPTFDALACLLVAWPCQPLPEVDVTPWMPQDMLRITKTIALGVLAVAYADRAPLHIHHCAYVMGPWPGCVGNGIVIAVIALWERWKVRNEYHGETQPLRV